MKTLTIKNIAKSYANKDLFAEISFSVTRGDRIAVIGQNGTGKSTLLKILAQLETADEGSVVYDRYEVAYIAQDFSGDTSLSILDYLDSVKAKPKVFELIKTFGVLSDKEVSEGIISNLSGGQKRVLEITAVLSRAPMFVCIDEPENHLDIWARSKITQLLANYWGGVICVSHDRHLINAVANKILLLEDGTGTLVSDMSYEEFLQHRTIHLEKSIDRWKSEYADIKKLEENVRMLKQRTRYNDSQARTYQMKKRELERRQEALGPKPVVEKETANISTEAVRQKTGKLIVRMEDVSFSYDQTQQILDSVSLEARFGQKIILLGRNGVGKTSVLELLQGNLTPQQGEVTLGVNLKTSYVDQHNTLDHSLSPLELFREIGIEEQMARSVLAQILFSQKEAETQFGNLSNGQQLRLRFSLLFRSKPDFIILDEPTNNLDPVTWELLLKLVNEFAGTVLIVSHDRSFLEQIHEPRIWVLDNGKVKEKWSAVGEVLGEL